jgi:predicted RNA-binding Zn ribbon-like protein
MQRVLHSFSRSDLVADHLALDLLNTVTARDAGPLDWLQGFDNLVQWATLTGRFTRTDLVAIRRAANDRPAAAVAALQRCRRLREALHDTLQALHQGRAVPAVPLRQLALLRQALLRRTPLHAGPGRVAALPGLATSGLDLIADTVLLDALDLLQAPPLARLRVCGGKHCGWWFLDTSKAGRRRWCDMATCGAALKALRHRQRVTAQRALASSAAASIPPEA